MPETAYVEDARCCPSLISDLRGSYINGPVETALLDLRLWMDAAHYRRDRCHEHPKSIAYTLRLAERNGVESREFAWHAWAPGVVLVNASAAVRQGRPMGAFYRRSLAEIGHDPNEELKPPPCPQHWRQVWGAFIRQPGGQQTLAGYISLIRSGNLAVMSMVLGHRAYERFGVMTHLHFEVVRHLYEQRVDVVMYAGIRDGQQGLKDRKRRLGFVAASLKERA